MCVIGAVAFEPAVLAAPQRRNQNVTGFVPPTVMPPPGVVSGEVATGLIIGGGGGSAGVAAGIGGAPAALLAAAGVAAFAGTTLALNAAFPCGIDFGSLHVGPSCMADPMTFPTEPVQSNLEFCNRLGPVAQAAAASAPAGASSTTNWSAPICQNVAISPIRNPGGTAMALRASHNGFASGSEAVSLSWDTARAAQHVIVGVYYRNAAGEWGWASLQQTSSGGQEIHWRWLIEEVGSWSTAQSIYVVSRQAEDGMCQGLPICSIGPASKLAVRIGTALNTSSGYTTKLEFPVDRRVAQHGVPMRTVATKWCVDEAGNPESESPYTHHTPWYYQASPVPIEFPACATATGIATRIRSVVQLPDGYEQEQLDISLNPAHLDAIRALRTCVGGCAPVLDPVTEQCVIGSTNVSAAWCTAQEGYTPQTGQPVIGAPTRTPTGGPSTNPPATTPSTPTNTPTTSPIFSPTNNDDECFPSGWGLLNPVDWVLKPVKCALVWAFVPEEALEPRVGRLLEQIGGTGAGSAFTTATTMVDSVTGPLAELGNGPCAGPSFDITYNGNVETVTPVSSCDGWRATLAASFRLMVAAVWVFAAGASTVNYATRVLVGHPIVGEGSDD
jgi:hypothetical protein